MLSGRLGGCSHATFKDPSTMPARTFRIFVSSTFSDLKAERNALARSVFPRLKALCEARGYQFQAVDLRWGVGEEASIDQQAVRLCLDEIARCQRMQLKPNFIVLLADRYGWRPPPSAIETDEMDRLAPLLSEGAHQLVFGDPSAHAGTNAGPVLRHGWYRRDENAVPPAYVLQPRQGGFEPSRVWDPVERALRLALSEAAHRTRLGPRALRKYVASATELEIMKGALEVEDAREHVFAFYREVENLEDVKAALPAPGALDLVDTDASSGTPQWDEDAWAAQQQLKAMLTDAIGEGNVWRYRARWQEGALSLGDALDELPEHPAPLEQGSAPPSTTRLCEAVWHRLSRILTEQMDAHDQRSDDALEVEIEAHREHAAERTRVFVGREEPLRRIAEYLGSETTRPLVVHGVSGSGKTALMARAVEQARAAHSGAVIVERYIGAAFGSSDARSLLESVCKQLGRELGGDEADLPTTYDKLVGELPKKLELATPEQLVFVFFDALDQLADSDNGRSLWWLPRQLPPHVRIVVSTLPEEQHRCFPRLRASAQPEDLVVVDAVPESDGQNILERLLESAQPPRTLTPAQRHLVLDGLGQAGTPLYLKLAFEEARRWPSYSGPSEPLPADAPGLIRMLFARLRRDRGELIVSRSLGFLAAARHGLNDAELLALLRADDDVWQDFNTRKHHELPADLDELPPILWSALYFDFEPYLAQRQVFGAQLFAFYHRQLAEAAAADFLVAEGRTTKAHSQLADYFAKRWQRPDPHTLVELIGQLVLAGRTEEASGLLLSYPWIQAKVSVVGVAPAIADYEELNPDRQTPLGLMRDTLRLSAHVLGPRPEELAGQILGRIADREEPELVALVEEVRNKAPRPALLPVWRRLTAPGGALLRTLEGHNDSVNAIGISPDGKIAVSGSEDKTVKLWDLDSGALLHTLEGHTNQIKAVAISPNGKTALSGSWDKTLRLWNLDSGSLVRTLEGHTHPVNAVAVSPDGRTALSGSSDNTLKLWNLDSGSVGRTLEGHTGSVTAVAFCPDGKTAVSGSIDKTLKLWNLDSGSLVRTLEGHSAGVLAVAISPDGKTAVSGSIDKTLKLWNLDSGSSLRTLVGHTGEASEMGQTGKVSAVVISPDGKTALSGSGDQTLKLWDLESGFLLRTLEGHLHFVSAVAISSDGKTAVSGSNDKTLKLWNLDSGSPRQPLRSALSGSWDDVLKAWDPQQASPLREGHTEKINAVAISPDGKTVLSGSDDETLTLWDLDSGSLLRTLEGHSRGVTAVAIKQDGKTALSGSWDKTLKLWDLDSGSLLRTLEGHGGGVMAVAISPDGKTALSGSNDNTLKLWNLDSGCVLHTLEAHASRVNAVTISPDGRTALSGSADNTLKLWDLDSGLLVRTLEGHKLGLTAVAISPDGTRAVSGSWDATLKLWDLDSASLVRTMAGHAGWVNAVAISLDGKIALSGSNDKKLKLWDLESGQPLSSLSGESGFHAIAISPAGHRLCAGDETGHVHLFDILLPLHLNRQIPRRPAVTPVGEPMPHPVRDNRREPTLADRASELNIKYQRELTAWKALPWLKRLTTKKPEPPRGI